MRDQTPAKGLQRAELARRTGSNLETIRYYEKVGLLPPPPRTASGYRSYGKAHELRLNFVLRARTLGFSLDEVRALLRLVDERDQPCAEASRLAAAHLADVRTKIVELRRMEDVLQTVVAQCGDGTRPDCPLIEALSHEATFESGGELEGPHRISTARPRKYYGANHPRRTAITKT